MEPSGAPLAYEVRLSDSGGITGNWTNVGHTYSLTLSALPLETNVSHTVEVRAVNLAGVASDSLAENFTFVTVPPQVASSGNDIVIVMFDVRSE